MRTISAPHRALLGGSTVAYFLTVEVENETGTWINLSVDPVQQHDWIDEVAFTENIDQPVASGTLTVKREIEDGTPFLSLAPFIGASPLNVDDLAAYSPLLHPGRGVRIWLAPMAIGSAAPAFPGADWHAVFVGILGKPQWGPGHTVSVGIRDLGARLADTIIEEERIYGSSAGIAVEDVMNQILEDNGFLGLAVTVPVSPGWFLHAYTQARVPVLEALRALALQIGWDLRYRFPATGDVPVLTLFAPDRSPTFVNLTNGITITPAEYLTVDELELDDDAVRNFGRLIYVDGVSGTRAEVTAQNLASVNAFGRRYIEISEDDSSNIDTATEAQAMIDAVIADLALPFATHAITTFHLWPLQLNDLIEFAANDIHYDDAQTYAIVQIAARFAKGHAESTIQTRGTPAGAYKRWILMHGNGPVDPDGVPSPVFTFLLGEESHGGGVSGDGMVWIGVKFERNTEYVEIWGEEGPDANTPTPDIANNSSAVRLTRQEGVDSSADDWETLVGIATRPLRWRKIRACGFGRSGLKGPDWTPPAVQAIDPVPTPIDGEILDFTVATTALDDNILSVTPGTIDPGGGNFIIVRRDGVDLMMIFIDADNSPKFITDTAINPNNQYNYEVFIWNRGVSGRHWRYGAGLPAPPGLVWAQQAPKLIFDNGLQQYFVAFYWSLTGYPSADHIVFEYGKNGVDFPGIVGSTSVLSTVKLDPNIKAKWYRMRLEDSSNTILAYSPQAFFPGAAVPPSWGGTPAGVVPLWDPVPTAGILHAPGLFIGVPSLIVGFICPVSGSVTCEIQGSDDAGVIDPWVVDYESPNLAGDKWYAGPGIPARYFRLVAKDANDVEIAVSSTEFWPGFVT